MTYYRRHSIKFACVHRADSLQMNNTRIWAAIVIVFMLLLSILSYPACAMIESRPIGNEARIKVINYAPNSVIKFVGHFMYHSIIEFGADESVANISMGTPGSWQINPAKNRIFIKPINEKYSTTNMTVITNKRMYFFELHATHAENIHDKNLAFITKFIYPNFVNDMSKQKSGAVVSVGDGFSPPDLSKPHLYNFEYAVSGEDRELEPILVFDDGEFTYLKFRDINAELPAIFNVSKDGRESLINYRVVKGYVIVESVGSQLSLKKGRASICLFNKSFDPLTWQNKNKNGA